MNQQFIKILFSSKTHRKIEINKKIIESTIHRRHLSLFGAKHTKDSKDFACSMLSLLILSRALLSKRPTLGAEPNFRIQCASFLKKIEFQGSAPCIKFLEFPTNSPRPLKTNKFPTNSTRILKTNNSDEFDTFRFMKPKVSNSSEFRRIRHPSGFRRCLLNSNSINILRPFFAL